MTEILPQALQAGGVLAFAYLIWRQQIRIANAIQTIGEDLAVVRDRQERNSARDILEREPGGRFDAGESDAPRRDQTPRFGVRKVTRDE